MTANPIISSYNSNIISDLVYKEIDRISNTEASGNETVSDTDQFTKAKIVLQLLKTKSPQQQNPNALDNALDNLNNIISQSDTKKFKISLDDTVVDFSVSQTFNLIISLPNGKKIIDSFVKDIAKIIIDKTAAADFEKDQNFTLQKLKLKDLTVQYYKAFNVINNADQIAKSNNTPTDQIEEQNKVMFQYLKDRYIDNKGVREGNLNKTQANRYKALYLVPVIALNALLISAFFTPVGLLDFSTSGFSGAFGPTFGILVTIATFLASSFGFYQVNKRIVNRQNSYKMKSLGDLKAIDLVNKYNNAQRIEQRIFGASGMAEIVQKERNDKIKTDKEAKRGATTSTPAVDDAQKKREEVEKTKATLANLIEIFKNTNIEIHHHSPYTKEEKQFKFIENFNELEKQIKLFLNASVTDPALKQNLVSINMLHHSLSDGQPQNDQLDNRINSNFKTLKDYVAQLDGNKFKTADERDEVIASEDDRDDSSTQPHVSTGRGVSFPRGRQETDILTLGAGGRSVNVSDATLQARTDPEDRTEPQDRFRSVVPTSVDRNSGWLGSWIAEDTGSGQRALPSSSRRAPNPQVQPEPRYQDQASESRGGNQFGEYAEVSTQPAGGSRGGWSESYASDRLPHDRQLAGQILTVEIPSDRQGPSRSGDGTQSGWGGAARWEESGATPRAAATMQPSRDREWITQQDQRRASTVQPAGRIMPNVFSGENHEPSGERSPPSPRSTRDPSTARRSQGYKQGASVGTRTY